MSPPTRSTWRWRSSSRTADPTTCCWCTFLAHGVKDEGGELYFATTNTRLQRLAATAVAAEFVNRRMSRSRSRRVVVLLDCCYAGAFERGMTARAGTGVGIEEQFGGRGRAVITASSAMEYAFEGNELADARELAPSVFTSALVEGLQTGEADRDQDGRVALGELYDFVYDKVRAATPNQTPGRWMFGVEGDLYIARRSRPVTTPAPLPPELQEAADSPLAGVRASVVPELARLLGSRHAGLVLAARLTLERLADDDSRMVCAAATAALGAQVQPEALEPVPPKLRLSTSVVDFGRLPEHSQSPERRVQLSNDGGGTLNARGATEANWLELRQEGDELVIRVDTTMVGEHEGVVTVDSDGGSATIRVLMRIDATPLPTSEPATTTHSAVPAAPERDRSGTRNKPTPRDTSKSAPREPPVPAPMPGTPASGVERPAAGRTRPPQGYSPVPGSSTQPARHTERVDRAERGIRADEGHDDRPLRFAGGLAIAGAALWVLSLSQAFAEGGPSQVSIPEFRSYVLILAALASGAGTCMLLPRIQRVIGPGILLGTVAAANYALLSEAVSFVYATREDWMGTGLLLNLIAGVTLAIAACLAAVTLVRTHDVHIVSRPPADTLAWLVVLLGAVGAIAFFGHFQQDSARAAIDTSRWFLIPRVWVTAMALVVPASAAVAAPRRFAAALLAGWIGGGAALFFVRLRIPDPWIVVFACTLVALLLILIPFARAAPTAQAKGTPEEVDQ